jgi:hypothetical protein
LVGGWTYLESLPRIIILPPTGESSLDRSIFRVVAATRVFYTEYLVVLIVSKPSTFSTEVVAPWPQASGGAVRYASGKEESALAA